jgi:radical SAM superfamily enzyme YgiQ (UPF0313 family)
MGDYRSTDAMPPLAMGILAARARDHRVLFYDDRLESVPVRLDADLAALSVETFTARRAYQLADRFREQGVPVVMGGHHPTFLPEEALAHADAVVVGDAEQTWERLLSDAHAGFLQRIYKGDNRAELTDYRVDRSIFKGKSYAPVEMVQYGRGCRFTCDFCSIHRFYGPNLRVRPPDHIRLELETLNRKRLLFFVDDNIYSSDEQLDTLLATIKPFKLRWSCQISIDIAKNPPLMDRLADSGCRYVLIGFESMEPKNLLQMGKSWNGIAGSYMQVVREFHQRGIGVYGTFVFGYDHDTPDTIRRSLEFAMESRLEIANFNPLTPTPDTFLYNRLREENRLLSPRWWLDPNYRYGDPIFVPASMTAEQLAEGCFEAKRQFYAWSSIARRLVMTDKPFSPISDGMVFTANLISRREVFNKQGRLLGK